MATRWDFKLCCVASRLLFDIMCCLEMEQIYAETVSKMQFTLMPRLLLSLVLSIKEYIANEITTLAMVYYYHRIETTQKYNYCLKA